MPHQREGVVLALQALRKILDNVDDDCGEPHCPDCKPWRLARRAAAVLEQERTSDNELLLSTLDDLRFVQRILESSSPLADRAQAAKIVGKLRKRLLDTRKDQ